MTAPGNNRLAVLAAEIKEADGRCRRSAEAAAAAAIEAGHKLIEAKELLQHGEWLTWLREHAGISERTARRYMQLARSGMEIGHVADLGIKGAAESLGRRDQTADRAVDAAIDFLRVIGIRPTPQDVADVLLNPAAHDAMQGIIEACNKRLVELAEASGVSGAYDFGVPTDSIIFVKECYPRSQFDLGYVADLATRVGELPPIEINQKGELIDGRYRLEAHKACGLRRIRVTVTETRDRTHHLALACQRNSSHGLPFSCETRERVAGTLRCLETGASEAAQ